MDLLLALLIFVPVVVLLAGVIRLVRGGSPVEATTGEAEEAINPAGVAIALLGALALIIGVFLPRAESPTFTLGGIQQNTLIQSGIGWIFLLFAVAVVADTFRASKTGRAPRTGFIVVGLLAFGLAVYAGVSNDALRLYRLSPDGTADTSSSIAGSPGVGVYVVGVGALLVVFGGVLMRREPVHVAPSEPTGKRCPDCAETVQAAARVCRYCGFRFEGAERAPHQADAT